MAGRQQGDDPHGFTDFAFGCSAAFGRKVREEKAWYRRIFGKICTHGMIGRIGRIDGLPVRESDSRLLHQDLRTATIDDHSGPSLPLHTQAPARVGGW